MSDSYRGSGSASYHPKLLLGILVYGYATGVFSSRKLERAAYGSVAFRYVVTSLKTGDAEHIYATVYSRAGRPKTSSSCTEANVYRERQALTQVRKPPLTAPVAGRRSPANSASSCTPPPIGCYSMCAIMFRAGIPCGRASSPASASIS